MHKRYLGIVLIAATAIVAILALSLTNEDPHGQRSQIAGIVPGTVSTVTSASGRDKIVDQQGVRAEPASYNPPPRVPIPGEIREGGCGPRTGPQVKRTNQWRAGGSRGNEYLWVLVCGGAYRKSPNTGHFLIVKGRAIVDGNSPSTSTIFDQALVRRSGPVRITDAPLGEEGSARVWDAHIEFEGTLGTIGYLDLADDSIHITHGPTLCPPDATGTPPNCGEAKLSAFKVTPKRRAVRRGRKAVFKAKIENTGEAAAWGVQICVKVPKQAPKPKRKRAKVVSRNCQWTGRLDRGESATGRFKIKVKKNAIRGRKITLKFGALSDVGAKHAKTTIKVRQRHGQAR